MTFPAEKIRLSLRPVSQLRPHEETVSRLSEELRRALLKEGVQRDPVVVDDATGTILDGTHRVEALRDVGAQLALVYPVEYQNPEILLYRWYRTLRNPPVGPMRGIIGEIGLRRLESFRPEEWSGGRGRVLVLVYRGEAFALEGSDIGEAVRAMRTFDRAAERMGRRVDFVDSLAARPALRKSADAFLIPPVFGKADVLRAGAEGRPFPPKSTLHVFPLRPLGVRYPIADLCSGRDNLEVVLRSKTARLVESHSDHGGRSYRERIVVFE